MSAIFNRRHLSIVRLALLIGVGVLALSLTSCGGDDGDDGTPIYPPGTVGTLTINVDWTNIMVSALKLEAAEITQAAVPGGTAIAVVTITGPDMSDVEVTMNASSTLTIPDVPAGEDRTVTIDGYTSGSPAIHTHTGVLTGVSITADTTNTIDITVNRLATSGGQGTLMVTTNAEAAQFTVVYEDDGTTYEGSGATWSRTEVAEGTYTVTYADIEGNLTPDPQTGYLEDGGTLIFPGIYILITDTGTITVTTNLESAAFTLTGPEGSTYNGSGEDYTISNAPAGSYTITYAAVPEYNPPAEETQTLNAGETIEFSGLYTAAYGSITVSTNLDDAVFSIDGPDGISYSGSGKSWTQTDVPDGSYTITYGAVEGYTTPEDETRSLSDGAAISFIGNYSQAGGTIQVTTNLEAASFTLTGPGDVIYEGEGESWSVTGAPAGSYEITYDAVPNYDAPANETKELVNNGSISFSGDYVESYGWFSRSGALRISQAGSANRYPAVVVDSGGYAYVSWFGKWGDQEVFYSALNRTDLSAVYGPIQVSDDTNESLIKRHGLAINEDGDVFLVWEDDRHTDKEIYFASAAGVDGDALVDEKRITDNTGTSTAPAVALDSDGDVHIVWQDNSDGNNEIYYVKLNGGTGSEAFAAVRVTNDGADSRTPCLVVDDDDDVHIVWSDNRDGNYDIYYAKLSGVDGSVDVSPTVMDDDATADRQDPAAAISGDDLFVVYENDDDDDSDIYLMKIDASSGTVEFNEDVITGDSRSRHSELALGSGGYVYLAWTDNRDGNNEIYAAKVDDDDGDLLVEPQRITDDTGDSEWPAIAVDANGNVYITWEDDRSGMDEVYIDKGVLLN